MTRARAGCVATLSVGLAVIAGCGSAPPPTQSQTDAVAAVRAAEALDAASTPAAAYELELARGELQQADALIHQGHMEQARDVLEDAKVDAQLAIALRREAEARASAAQTHEHLDDMRQDTISTSGGVAPAPGPQPVSHVPQTTTTTTVTTTGAAPQ